MNQSYLHAIKLGEAAVKEFMEAKSRRKVFNPKACSELLSHFIKNNTLFVFSRAGGTYEYIPYRSANILTLSRYSDWDKSLAQ